MLQISQLFIYPIKSLGGIELDKARVTDRGLEYDRRWMLIDENNRFVSQREFPRMALLKPAISDKYLTVTDYSTNTSINISLNIDNKHVIKVSVWDDICEAALIDGEIDAWFTKVLGVNVRLVHMYDEAQRFIEEKYAGDNEITSFADAFPFLLIGQASLDDLNKRLDERVSIDRFRPNIVFTGAAPYYEDMMDNFIVNGISFKGVKLCARCNMITIDQSDATTGKEPTTTLASYRRRDKKIYFGQNLIHKGTDIISVGDELQVLTTHTNERFFIPG